MLSSFNCIEELLGLKDAVIKNIEKIPQESEIHIHFELKRNTLICPQCNELTKDVHDYRTQIIKAPPLGSEKLILHYRKRRYRCPHCQKRFYEPNNFVPKYHRMTYGLEFHILDLLRECHSVKSIANKCNVSSFTVNRLFSFLSFSKPKLPRTLGIDEFRGNAGGEKFQCILTDPENHKVIDILPGRQSYHLTSYFSSFSKNEREKVEIVVMDMTHYYRDLVKIFFPKAIIVADRFHYLRLVYWAFDKVRKQEQQKLHPDRRKYFKRSKSLLWKKRSKLTEENIDAVEMMLKLSPKLAKAYLIKERFLEFINSKDITEAKNKLSLWFALVDSCKLEEFNSCKESLFNWLTPVLNSFLTPFTNGFTEGSNNKIKVLKRNAYGLRNFDRLRSRILYMFAS
mgnify:CR=1 FL=1